MLLSSPLLVNDNYYCYKKKNDLLSCYKSGSVGLKKYHKVLPPLVGLNVTKNFAEMLKRDKFKAVVARSYIQKLCKERDSKLKKKKSLKLNNISYNNGVKWRCSNENAKKNVSKIFLELKVNSEVYSGYKGDDNNKRCNKCFQSLNVNKYCCKNNRYDRNYKQNRWSYVGGYNSNNVNVSLVSNENNSMMSSSFSNALLKKKMFKSLSANHI